MAETNTKKKSEQKSTLKDARLENMRRVLLPLYEEWLKQGMPVKT